MEQWVDADSEHKKAVASDRALYSLERTRLRILRCTAKAMATTPGGLRFVAGTRPWLEGLGDGSAHISPNRGQAVNASPTLGE